MAHEFPPLPTHRLAHILAALRGLARVIDPDPELDGHDRGNLYFLIMLLTEHLDTCLRDIMHEFRTLHDTLRQAQAAQPAREEE
jgi:hypothetical protein